jgi:Flp pilus assembly secretin CpaC
LHHTLRATFTAAAVALITLIPLGVRADAPNPFTVRTGQSVIVRTPGLTRVAVGDAKIAGVVAIGNTEIVLNGKTSGRTTLFVWTNTGRHTYFVTVTEQYLEDLQRMLQSAITLPSVRVDEYENSLVLNGTVSNSDDLVQLANVVSRFAPIAAAGKYSIVNAVTAPNPMSTLQSSLASSPATASVTVARDMKGDLVVSGGVPDRATAEMVLSKARMLSGAYLATDAKVIDRLETATTSQVDVKVYILEVDDTAMKQLGISLQSATFLPNSNGFTLGQPAFPFVESPSLIGKAFAIGSFFRTITLAPTLNLVINSGHAKLLSSPNLVTMPGHQADFLVGGQIPIPFASGPQQIAIEYKDFGVRLKVTPTILGNGNIETVIAPEVSDLDFTDGVTLNGFVVPALKTSKLSTDVITKEGESIVMGGLVRRMEQRNINKIPLLGDLPIIGKLFRSTSYQNNQTDVIFIMTPTILTR